MYDDLAQVLNGRTSPELYSGIDSICNALEKHKATGWKDLITRLMIDNEDDSTTLVDRAVGIVYMQVEALFKQMNIKLDLDVMNMTVLANVIEALAFEPSDFDGEILAALQASDDSVDALCNALAIKLNVPVESTIEYVLGVSDATIIQLTSVVQRSSENEEFLPENLEEILGNVNKHQTMVTTGKTLGMEALAAGVRCGTHMPVMVEYYKQELDPASPETIVDNLLSLALVAGIPKDAIEDEVVFFLEQIYPEIFEFQRARKFLVRRLADFTEGF
jgi:hypothetical protein